ncbi:MAG: DUF3472 domain-containing protein [Phycisphaeraceae bacterium]
MPRSFTIALTCFAIAFSLLAPRALADERLKGIACRSIHLGYGGSNAVAFYNEITVKQSAIGTYFAVCGWDKGYFGIQELASGKKLAIFSVWDSQQNDPKAVEEDKRTKLLHKDDKTRIGRFGGEGTGGQSFYDLDWKVGETWRFLVTAQPAGQRTEYAGHLYLPDEKRWVHMVTFSTITGGRRMGGLYSFVEDFKRDRVSATKPREAVFGNGWSCDKDGKWTSLNRARFTADSNPVTNINAGLIDDRFFLITGGDTENTGTKLRGTMTLPPGDRKLPDDLPPLPAPPAPASPRE